MGSREELARGSECLSLLEDSLSPVQYLQGCAQGEWVMTFQKVPSHPKYMGLHSEFSF